jgi:hypothetical protein
MTADSASIIRADRKRRNPTVRKLLLSAVAIGGLTALCSAGATAAPVVGAAGLYAAPQQHIVQADWYWRRHHWHHRRWFHGRWHYWD